MTDPGTILMFLSLLAGSQKGAAAPAGPPGPPGPAGGGPLADAMKSAADAAAQAAQSAAQNPAAANAAAQAATHAAAAAASVDPSQAQAHAQAAQAAALDAHTAADPVGAAQTHAAVAAQAASISQDPTAQAAAQDAAAHAQAAAQATNPADATAHAQAAQASASQAVTVAMGTSAAPAPVTPASAPITPAGTTSPNMPPWGGSVVPSTLPPFPGPGWTPDTPVSQSVIARAVYWNPQLWNFAAKQIVKPFVQEQLGGRWLTFVAAWHPDASGNPVMMATEAWRLSNAPAAGDAAGASAPSPMQQAAVQAAAAATTPAPHPAAATASVSNPVPTGPYPGPGAWSNNPGYIARVQAALTSLGYDTRGVDGKNGPNTMAAVRKFQADKGLSADGQAGAATSAAIDAALAGAQSLMNAALATPGGVSGALPPGMSPRQWWAAMYPGTPFPLSGRMPHADAVAYEAYHLADMKAETIAKHALPPGMSPRQWWAVVYPGTPFPSSGRMPHADAVAYEAYHLADMKAETIARQEDKG